MKSTWAIASAFAVLAFSGVQAQSGLEGSRQMEQGPTATCAKCASSATLAQLGPVRGRPMQAIDPVTMPHDPLPPENGAPSICCDPAMFIPINQFMGMFKDDPLNGLISANFGIIFNPTPAFKNSVNNTAFIANTLLGLPFSHFIIRAEMRTDDQPHTAFVPGTLASTFGGRIVRGWNQNFYVEDSPLGSVMAANANPFTQVLNAPSDMVRDGRRYIIKFTYWVAYTDRTGNWVARQVICNNVPDRYIGISKDTVGAKIGAGSSGPTIAAGEDAPGGGRMTFGEPVPLRPEEIQMLKQRN